MLLSEDESNFVWDFVYNVLNFKPSVKQDVKAFEIELPYVVYDISSMNSENRDIMYDVITKIFIECTSKNEYMYALDWRHSNYKFHPRNKSEQQFFDVIDDSGYTAYYFPEYYPNGDYYFFIASDFRFGYLGHPWQQKVWIFGKELIASFETKSSAIGFVKIE